MRATAERFARRWWAGELGFVGRALDVVAAPASWLWAGASRARARSGRPPQRVQGLRVISVGNLAVGGTGKTPFSAWVVGALREAGARAAVLVGEAGADEALLHRAWSPGVSVLVGRDRVSTARQAVTLGAGVAVLDDGFQHRALGRDLDIVLLSADDPDTVHVLPRGPYRESRAALARADVVVVTRRTAGPERARALASEVEHERPGLVFAGVHLAPGAWKTLEGGAVSAPTDDVLVACAIARPDAFQRAVAEQVDGAVEVRSFADHHAYTDQDVARLASQARGRSVVVTEKDAAKLNLLASSGVLLDRLGDVRVLADEIRWDWGEESVRAEVRGVAEAACIA